VILVTPTATFPLILTLNQEGVGGITGQTPTVALRRILDNEYLDWATNTFKASGWTTKYQPMNELERGNYQVLLTADGLLSAGTYYAVEYNLNGAGSLKGQSADLVFVTSLDTDVSLLRKALTNRMEETGGSPGLLILYDDDGVTPLKTWQLRDETGGTVVSTVGAPARRSQAT